MIVKKLSWFINELLTMNYEPLSHSFTNIRLTISPFVSFAAVGRLTNSILLRSSLPSPLR